MASFCFMPPLLPEDNGLTHQVKPAEDDSHHKTRAHSHYLLEIHSNSAWKTEVRKSFFGLPEPRMDNCIFSSATTFLSCLLSSCWQFLPDTIFPPLSGHVPVVLDTSLLTSQRDWQQDSSFTKSQPRNGPANPEDPCATITPHPSCTLRLLNILLWLVLPCLGRLPSACSHPSTQLPIRAAATDW